MDDHSADSGKRIDQLEEGKAVRYKGITLKRTDFALKTRVPGLRLALSPTMVRRLQDAVLRGLVPTDRYIDFRNRARTAKGAVEVENELRRWFRDEKLATQPRSQPVKGKGQQRGSNDKERSQEAKKGPAKRKPRKPPNELADYTFETNSEEKLSEMKDFCRRRGVFPRAWTGGRLTYGLRVNVPPEKGALLSKKGWKCLKARPEKTRAKRHKNKSKVKAPSTSRRGRGRRFLQGGLPGLGKKR